MVPSDVGLIVRDAGGCIGDASVSEVIDFLGSRRARVAVYACRALIRV